MSLIQIPKGPKYVGETGHPVAGSDMGRKGIYLRDRGGVHLFSVLRFWPCFRAVFRFLLHFPTVFRF